MNLDLNIDYYGGKSILPVTCGSCRGTAFYIGNQRFLTAWHVVSESVSLNEDIYLIVDEKLLSCRLIPLGDMDVALLECENEMLDITPIELLKTDFRPNIDLEIIGYPQEIGNGIDFFGVKVKNLRKLYDTSKGFDVVVLRTDSFGFHSYSGFSGSPVLNTKGVAVGVVTDQLYNTLGYTSIDIIADDLTEKKVRFSENADQFDTRPFGIGTCMELATKACRKMKSRYTNNHIKDEDLETQLEVFCGYNVDRWEKEFRQRMNKWYQNTNATYKAAIDKITSLKTFMQGDELSNDCFRDMDYLLNRRESENSDDYFIRGKHRKELTDVISLMEVAQEAKDLSKKRFMYVHGDAGSGKTQHMCHFVERMSSLINIYLLFGTDFEAGKPIHSICKALHWDDVHTLDKLNAEMVQRNRFATFIVDALNEGAGTYIWLDLLPVLRAEIDRFSRLKLIVTVRTMEPGDMLNNHFKKGWVNLKTRGFSNLREAIEKYFDAAGIHENANDYLYVREFQKPLFLKIFCQVYHQLPYEYRKDLDILLLYQLYYKSRNTKVSHRSDEDPERMITPKIMRQIGDLSLFTYNCGDVPRAKVVELSNEMCPNRLWSNSLYHSLLQENLIMEYWLNNELMTTFEYDSMGDYMRTQCILLNKKRDYSCLDTILAFVKRLNNPTASYNEKKHINNTIKTFLSVWNPQPDIWHNKEFQDGALTCFLLDSLGLRNMKSEKSTLPKDMVARIVMSNDQYINPEYLLANFTLYKEHLIQPVHELLMKMSMVERDERWTVNVNRMQDDYSFYFKIRQIEVQNNEDDVNSYLRLLCWMLTASHPQLRYHVTRLVYGWLLKYTRLCNNLIEAFYKCNDPYVLRGIYSSVYGVLLVKRDKDLIHQISKLIFEKLYNQHFYVPSEIEVRTWTLKILEFNHLYNPEDGYWEIASPPYPRMDNLLLVPDGEDVYKKDYFGSEGGALKLHRSLFEWDFNRYIIGTNTNNASKTYFRDGVGVSLSSITEAVAYRIKHEYKYSKKLSEYDDTVTWDTRSSRVNERIGKKYQWIALGEVKAYLCDVCQIKKDWWGNKPPVEIPYPWYDREKTLFDPTLTLTDNRSYLDQDIFDEFVGENLMVGDGTAWLNSRELVPKPIIVLKDKKGLDWVNIIGYQKEEQEKNDEKRESFIFICPCLVKNENASKFENWAKDQCFYGRWMPEDTGHYEYLWKEFPWSDSYKSMEFEEEHDIVGYGVSAPCKVLLPYATQLQEHREGIEDDDEFEGMVYMPSTDMFDYFELHTAERGVTRDCNETVVALCRNIQGDIFDTMVMRRELLNQYLQAKDLTLFYCMLAEKRLSLGPQQFFMQRLSCCMRYVLESEPIVIQQMKDERDFPKTESVEQNNNEILEGISPEIWQQIKQEGRKESILNLFKDYDEISSKRKDMETSDSDLK